MSKMEKVKGFFKKHKNKFFIIGGVAVGYVIGKTVVCRAVEKLDTNIDIPDLTIADFGKVGEEIIEACPDIKPDTVVQAWRVSIPKNR